MQEEKHEKKEMNSEEEAKKDVNISNEGQPESKQQKQDTKKIEKLEEALEKAEKDRDFYLDKYQRTFSEYNNYIKRNQSALSCAIKDGCIDTVIKILPVIDNFERALAHSGDSSDRALAEGVLMVYKQLSGILEALGVKEVPAQGEPFDPNLHQAIQQAEPSEGVKENTVVQVVQKGYMLDDKILRHSMVIVSK